MPSSLPLFLGALMSSMLCVAWPGSVEAAEPIYRLDLTSLSETNLKDAHATRRSWDIAHAAFTLQGIVNRESPRLLVWYERLGDDFWLDQSRRKGEWLAGREIVPLASLEAAIEPFRPMLKGLVVYDEHVPATSNVASTIAGVEDRIAVRYDNADGSLYRQLQAMRLGDEVRLIRDDGSPLFTGSGTIPGTSAASSGSAKCDAYLWAKAKYIDTKRVSPDSLAYYIDAFWLSNPAATGSDNQFSNCTLANHDYFVSHRAFFVDLDVWDDEKPSDDLGQPLGTDERTFRAILRALALQNAGRMMHVGGFIPWGWKYADEGEGFPGSGGRHHPVHSEWKHAELLSRYNGIKDADALSLSSLANASFYQHFPMATRYPQQRKPTLDDLRARGFLNADDSVKQGAYVAFYVGDYDSAAWLTRCVREWSTDPKKGRVPLNWAFDPILERRAPHVMDFARRNATDNDWFISGDNGAGYLIPTVLLAPRPDAAMPDGWQCWRTLCSDLYQKYDLTITGFVITGLAPEMTEDMLRRYQDFSSDGLMMQTSRTGSGVSANGMPWLQHQLDLDGKPAAAAARLVEKVAGKGPRFLMARTVLKSPAWHSDVVDELARDHPEIHVVDAYTLFALIRQNNIRDARQ